MSAVHLITMVIGYTQVVMQKSKSKSREDKKWQKNKLVSTTTALR